MINKVRIATTALLIILALLLVSIVIVEVPFITEWQLISPIWQGWQYKRTDYSLSSFYFGFGAKKTTIWAVYKNGTAVEIPKMDRRMEQMKLTEGVKAKEREEMIKR